MRGGKAFDDFQANAVLLAYKKAVEFSDETTARKTRAANPDLERQFDRIDASLAPSV